MTLTADVKGKNMNATITIDRKVIEQALDALESIALAGMSGSGQESEEGMREWHARQAWKFIGIAARAFSPLREALAQQQPVQQEPVAEVKARADSIGGTFIQRYAELAPGTKLYTSPQAEQTLAETQPDALNTLCKMLHSGEEVEGDDGLAMLVPMDLWNEAQDAIELLIGEDDGTEAANADLLAALKMNAQALSWRAFGECRGFTDDLPTALEATDAARAAIKKHGGAEWP